MKNNYHRLRASQDAIMNSLSRFISKKYVINIWQSIKMQLLVSNWRREYVMIEEAGPTIAWLLNLDNWRLELGCWKVEGRFSFFRFYLIGWLYPLVMHVNQPYGMMHALPDLAKNMATFLDIYVLELLLFVYRTFDRILLEHHKPEEIKNQCVRYFRSHSHRC